MIFAKHYGACKLTCQIRAIILIVSFFKSHLHINVKKTCRFITTSKTHRSFVTHIKR